MRSLSVATLFAALAFAPLSLDTALAHGHHHVAVSIRGTIVGLTPDGLRLQMGIGLASVGVTARTQVLRIVSGSLADLRAGERASLDLGPGGRTVKVVHLGVPVHMTDTTHHHGADDLTYQAGHGAPGAREVQGQIMTMSQRSVRMHCPHSPPTVYRFSNAVRVVKQMPGSRLQLAVGQSVQVMWNSDRTLMNRPPVASAVVIWGA